PPSVGIGAPRSPECEPGFDDNVSNTPSELHVWSVHENYCEERIKDRKGGVTVETLFAIVTNNRSTSILQGAL
ncbi:MAG: hypothetical protein ACQET1_09275, partial [Gemmatimonadota bacterium]